MKLRLVRKEIEIGVIALAVAALFVSAPLAYADKVFHSEQEPLVLTPAGETAGFPALTSGHVVDIHANGPTVYAIEEYMINGARANSNYQVADVAWLGGCPANPATPPSFTLPTVVLTSSANGFAEGEFKITPATITQFGLHGVTLGIVWTLTSDDVVAYSTPSCISVALD